MDLTCLPQWYVSPGTDKPAHLPAVIPAIGLQPGAAGPDGLAGVVFGASAYDPATCDDYRPMPGGWWVRRPSFLLPQHLVRISPPREVCRWTVVQGDDQHVWRVPVILANVATDGEALYVSALDRVWRGYTWDVSRECQYLASRLLAVAHGVSLGDDIEARNREMVHLACDLLAIGHHVHADELADWGWLTEMLIIKIVRAAIEGMP